MTSGILSSHAMNGKWLQLENKSELYQLLNMLRKFIKFIIRLIVLFTFRITNPRLIYNRSNMFSIIAGLTFVITDFQKKLIRLFPTRYSFVDQDLPLKLRMNSRYGIFKARFNPSLIFAIVYVYATIFTYLALHVGKLSAWCYFLKL